MKKTVVIIGGPTAVGKTAVAMQIAKEFGTAIISADSRQCYRELKIGVARPSEKELKEVEHFFIATHSVTEEVNAAIFEQYALQKSADLFELHDVVIMSGGTGFYIRAFCEGLDEIPEVEDRIRQEIIHQYAAGGMEWLRRQIMTTDPRFYEQGENQNPQRMMRALEVKRSSGKSILEFRQKVPVKRSFNIIKIALEVPREQLYRQINGRVEKMISEGLVNEVRDLLPFRHLNALQTVGYSEIFDYLDGKSVLEDAIEEIRKNTRHYAKRQMTWFRRDTAFQWFHPENAEEIIKYIRTKLMSAEPDT